MEIHRRSLISLCQLEHLASLDFTGTRGKACDMFGRVYDPASGSGDVFVQSETSWNPAAA